MIEDAIPSGASAPTASGNVLVGTGGNDANATDGVADIQGADGAIVVAVSAGGTAGSIGGPALAGQYGSLTLDAGGNYIYVLSNDNPQVQGLDSNDTLTEVFRYTIRDGDGDEHSTTLTITIQGSDDAITINGLSGTGAEETVYEANLAQGSSPDAAALVQSGTFDVVSPDGLATVVVGGQVIFANGALVPNVVVEAARGSLTITGVTLNHDAADDVISATFTYSYTLLSHTLDHSLPGADSVFDSVLVQVTDTDGSTNNASLDIAIVDDVPAVTASSAAPVLIVDDTTLTVDATASFAGAFVAAFGADGPGAGGGISYALSAVSGPSGLVDVATGQQVILSLNLGVVEGRTALGGELVFALSVDGSTGAVTLNQVRAVEHDDPLDPDEPGASAATLSAANLVTLTATVIDGDGDTTSAALAIGTNLQFEDDGPSVTASATLPVLVVDETVLTADAAASFAGVFTSAFGADGPATTGSVSYALGVVSGPSGLVDVATGEAVNLFLNGGVVEGRTATGGLLVFTLAVDTAGSVTLDQLRAVQHDDPADPDEPGASAATLSAANLITLTATVTDRDGDSASAVANIGQTLRFEDDGPIAANDGTYAVGEHIPITIHPLGNDVLGNDGVDLATGVTVGTLPTRGTVVYNGDGTFTYSPTPGEGGSDSFTYTITDRDGDSSTATVTLELVPDSIPQVTEADNVTLDEDGFPTANVDAARPGEVTGTGSLTGTGTLHVYFGADVPADLLAAITLVDTPALDGQLFTLDGAPVTFALEGGALVGRSGGTEAIRITITAAELAHDGTSAHYTYQATLSQPLQHPASGSEETP